MDEKNILNAITVDVEEWFHSSVFRNIIHFRDWNNQQSRIVPNICRILKIFEEHHIKGTFFIVGWIAAKYPEIVLTIKKYGHTIGSHSYSHRLVYEMTRKEFEVDLDRSISILEDITNEKVLYYRAPSFSINSKSLWALPILSERGIKYDSSIFPIKHDLYGISNLPRFPFCFNFSDRKRLFEFPPSTLRLFGSNIPIAGGGYLRLFPLWLIKNGIRRLNQMGEPAIIYFHPWELDSHLPKVHSKFSSRFRHYTNLEIMEERLRSLLSEFRFASIGNILETYQTSLESRLRDEASLISQYPIEEIDKVTKT